VLPGPGLGDDALLAHPFGEQSLTECIVDLVRAGVCQIFSLEVDPGPASEIRQVPREVEGRRSADVISRQTVDNVLELGITASLSVGGFQLVEGRHQRLRRILAAELPKSATRIRHRGGRADHGRAPSLRFQIDRHTPLPDHRSYRSRRLPLRIDRCRELYPLPAQERRDSS
jgi:hypothetical protein